MVKAAASARLCVETNPSGPKANAPAQPPPRGCVLKQAISQLGNLSKDAAASARLCVETANILFKITEPSQPPPRGCVLKLYRIKRC